jgi:hypothetical protein
VNFQAARIPTILCLVGLLMVIGSDSRATEEFHALICPDTSWVNLHSFVAVQLEVDSTAHRFNGYEIAFQFDPSVVSFDSITPGELMIEDCPNWFNHFESTESTVTYSLIILCDLISVDGPGCLCTLRFSADDYGTSPVTIISNPDRSFFDAGLYVCPDHPAYPRQVIFHDGAIVVADLTDCAEGLGEPRHYTTSIRPNPMYGQAQVLFDLPESAVVRLALYDATGRFVRTLINGPRVEGSHAIDWDGTDEAGRPVPNGVYFCRISTVSFQSQSRIVLLQ